MSKKPIELETRPTLTDDQIESGTSRLDRRSALKVLGATVVGTGAAAVASTMLGCIVQTQPQPVAYTTGVTDNDTGPYADPAGNGRGTARAVYTGISDSDGGAYADAAGYGRGHYGRSGWSSGLTDSDGGPYADAAGNGRGTYRGASTGLTDGDAGPYADPAGGGRGRYR